MVAKLVLEQFSVDTNKKESPREFSGDALRIGRSNECNIVIDNAKVSRAHANIIRFADGWAVYDCGSTNGTHVIRGTNTYEVPKVAEGGKLDRMHIFTLQGGDIIVLSQKIGLKVCKWQLN